MPPVRAQACELNFTAQALFGGRAATPPHARRRPHMRGPALPHTPRAGVGRGGAAPAWSAAQGSARRWVGQEMAGSVGVSEGQPRGRGISTETGSSFGHFPLPPHRFNKFLSGFSRLGVRASDAGEKWNYRS